MKLLFILVFISYSFGNIKAQLSGRYSYAKLADIKDQNGKLIAKMSVVPGLKSEIFFKDFDQWKDSVGDYISEYIFFRPNHLEAKNITLILQFSGSFKNVYFNTVGEAKNIRTTIDDINKTGTSFQASILAADATISIVIVSEEPIIPTITGIAGQSRKDYL